MTLAAKPWPSRPDGRPGYCACRGAGDRLHVHLPGDLNRVRRAGDGNGQEPTARWRRRTSGPAIPSRRDGRAWSAGCYARRSDAVSTRAPARAARLRVRDCDQRVLRQRRHRRRRRIGFRGCFRAGRVVVFLLRGCLGRGGGGHGGSPCDALPEPEPPTHQNPLTDSPCADPGAIRWERPGVDACGPPLVDYWMACTGKGDGGGIYRLYHSTDLVDWEPAGSVFPPGHEPAWVGAQTWAPEIHRVGDRFVVYYSAQPPPVGSQQQYFCLGAGVADTPAGPFEDIGAPLLCDPAVSLIDASYLHEQAADRHWLVLQAELERAGQDDEHRRHRARTRRPVRAWRAHGAHRKRSALGGRHRGGALGLAARRRYHLFYSADLYNNGYKVGVARAASPTGPFEKLGHPILESSDVWLHPGHNSAVLAHGETFMVYHAYPAADPSLGRRPLLDRIDWDDDGWPMVNGGHPSGAAVDLLP